jgi:hypothetical protein
MNPLKTSIRFNSLLTLALIATGCAVEAGGDSDAEQLGTTGQEVRVPAPISGIEEPEAVFISDKTPPAPEPECTCVKAPCACDPQVRVCKGSMNVGPVGPAEALALVKNAVASGTLCSFEPPEDHLVDVDYVNSETLMAQPPVLAWVCEDLCAAIASHALTGRCTAGGTLASEIAEMMGFEKMKDGWVHTTDANGAHIFVNTETGQYMEHSSEASNGQLVREVIYNDGQVVTYYAESYAWTGGTGYAIQ